MFWQNEWLLGKMNTKRKNEMRKFMDLYKELCAAVGAENVLRDEPMSRHTTFRIGGPADFFVQPSCMEEIKAVRELCRSGKMPCYVMGNGSDLLVGDRGYRGVIIQICKRMNEVRAEGERIFVQSGALLSKTASAAYDASLTGMEFASGIPGTVGGALRMNAGAYDGEMKQIVESVEVLTADGEVLVLSAGELGMGYRTSVISKNDYVALSAVLKLKKGEKSDIRARMDELKKKRVEKQPLEYGSAGSTFKRPEGHFAGKLVQEAGLRGYRVGDAQVSEKHCGFVINRGNATAAEVAQLMEDVADRVQEKFGIRLDPEVKKIGEF